MSLVMIVVQIHRPNIEMYSTVIDMYFLLMTGIDSFLISFFCPA